MRRGWSGGSPTETTIPTTSTFAATTRSIFGPGSRRDELGPSRLDEQDTCRLPLGSLDADEVADRDRAVGLSQDVGREKRFETPFAGLNTTAAAREPDDLAADRGSRRTWGFVLGLFLSDEPEHKLLEGNGATGTGVFLVLARTFGFAHLDVLAELLGALAEVKTLVGVHLGEQIGKKSLLIRIQGYAFLRNVGQARRSTEAGSRNPKGRFSKIASASGAGGAGRNEGRV